MGFSYSGKLFGGTGSGGVSVSGGVNTQVAYFTGASSISSDSGLTYDATTDTLTNTGTVSARNLTATALATPGSITVAPQGTTGATTYTYRLVARAADGTTTEAGAASSTATGNATLDATNFNRLTWSAVTGAASYDVYRTVGGATQGKIASATTALTVDDTGLAGGGETAPTSNGTGVVTAAQFSPITLATTDTGAATAALTMPPVDSSVAHIGVWMGNTTFSGVKDPTMFWGYNYTPQKAAHPRFYWGLEGNFNDVPNSRVWAETYIERKDTGGTSYRPFIVGAYDGHAEAAFSTDTVSMLSRTGAGVGQFVNAGANPYFQLNANAYIMALGNNHHFLQQASALIPGAYLDLIGLSAADRVMLGGASVQGVDVASGSVLIGTYLVKDKGGYLTIRNSTDAYDADFEAGIVNIGGARLAFGTDDYSTVGTATLRPKEIHVTRAVLGSKPKVLTDATPTDFATIALADGAMTAGEIIYRVTATISGEKQVLAGRVRYTAIRDNTTYDCDVSEVGSQTTSVKSGTLTGAISCAAAAGVLTFSANFDSSLTAPTVTLYYRFDSTDVLAVTPL